MTVNPLFGTTAERFSTIGPWSPSMRTPRYSNLVGDSPGTRPWGSWP